MTLLTSPAQANDANVSSNACSYAQVFKFQLYFNSDLLGAWAKFGYSEENFGAYDGSSGYLIFNFCSGTGNGAGQHVKNNAASAGNWTYDDTCVARVHFNSYWKGVYDNIHTATPRNLVNTYNENASFKWVGSGC